MGNKKIQIRKKVLYLFMVICIMVVVQPEYVQASGSYTADWQRWSQGASGYSAMQYGCRVTAYSKMLAEAGYTGFGNPDGFFEWGKRMGYFRASDTCELTSIGTAPVTYVNNNGGTASLAGRQVLSGNKTTDADTIMNLIKQGYYVILTCSEHTAYVGREASLNQGTAVLLDSWASKAEGPSLQYKSYTLYTFQTANYFRITSSASVQLWGIYENDTFSGQAKFWAKRGDSDSNHYAIWYMDDVPLTGHTNSDSSGFFSVNVDTTKYSNGTHQLSIHYVNTGADYWDVRHINISNLIQLWGIYENDTFSGQAKFWAKRGDSDSNHYAIWYMDDVPLTGHTNSDSSGFFSVNVDTTKYSNGTHQLSIHYVNTGADYWDVRHINISNPIEKIDISIATVSLVKNQYEYTGSAIEPEVRVVYAGEILKKGTDYTLDYSNNIQPGTATIHITGTGNYSGILTVSFRIEKSAINGWVQDGGNRFYYVDGVKQTGWQKVSGKWHYMNGSGEMLTGWQKISGKWYYMNKSGEMLTGWQKISGKWYYMNGSGAMTTGWKKVSGKWYYMNKSGVMTTGWQKVSGKWYYMNGSGVMTTGWKKVSGKWYYMNGSGEMLTGWQKISGKWYYMNGSGEMLTGWQKISGKWYYMNRSGAMQL